jgi:hypothetical protein
MTHKLSRFTLVIGWATLFATGALGATQSAEVPAVLKESVAYYATLTSYADTGTVAQEVPGMIDTAKFTTYFRRPTRDLFLDYQVLARKYTGLGATSDFSAFRTLIWMVRGNMQTFDFRTQTLEQIDSTSQKSALSNASYGTNTASIVIPSLLYPQTRLPSSVLQLESAELAGGEDISGHRCHKVTGVAAAYYPNGRRTSVRPVSVWIDAETKLIRRIVEDTPRGSSSSLRLTLNFEPRANPVLEDAKFQFAPPVR